MQNKPLVSICTPVYRVERYIEECVQSVLDQTYANIELLLVDDCGGDHSIELAEQVLKGNAKDGFTYRIIRSEHNEGVSAARNKAMRAATGKYIFCLDSDDKLLPQCIEKLVARAEETEADVVMCGHISDEGRTDIGGQVCAPIETIQTNADCIKSFAQLWFSLAPWCKLLRADFVKLHSLYFREGIINEDAPWIFQLCLNASSFSFIKEPLYYYRYNENSIMSAAKKQRVVESNEIALMMYNDEILKRTSLWENKDLYIIFMRQITIYYKLVYQNCSFGEYLKRIQLLKKLRYNSSRFASPDQPTSYKVWSKMMSFPTLFAGLLTYVMVAIQHR